ncbi:MAG: helix-hairpin-helix domain-containing protein [Anaerolineae bacterium]|nr:helix-hairpin-helix domain-containing protein [Phycisphaerae bacterium]
MRLQAPQLWTAGQRVALLAIVAALFAYLAIRYLTNSTYVSNPQPAEPSRASELVDRIDPNTADVATLAALPTLGEKRAKLIVDYRESRRANRPNVIVFQRLEDLLRIRGIGVATIDQLRPFLTFPTTVPTTQRDSR